MISYSICWFCLTSNLAFLPSIPDFFHINPFTIPINYPLVKNLEFRYNKIPYSSYLGTIASFAIIIFLRNKKCGLPQFLFLSVKALESFPVFVYTKTEGSAAGAGKQPL